MSKWATFYSAHSPLQITKVNQGVGTRLAEDWSRAVSYTGDPMQDRQILIDGQPITEYAAAYKGLKEVDQITKFFEEVILRKMDPKPKEEDKTKIIKFLTETFHQGGFMHPVSGALATSMEREALPDEKGARDGKIAYGTIGQIQLVVNIIPTKKGFNVKEYTGVKQIVISENDFDKFGISYDEQKAEGGEVYKVPHDPGIRREDNGNIIEAQGEIAVDLSNPGKPKISIESNAISYGDPRLESELHTHSLKQWIIDFVKNTLGYNKVEVLEAVPSVESTKSEDNPSDNKFSA